MANWIKPYGDTANDGKIQLCFTLPVNYNQASQKIAENYLSQLNLGNISISHSEKIADGFTYFVAFATAIPQLDLDSVKIVPKPYPVLSFKKINQRIKTDFKRPIRVIGASIGDDAHTVGIDAIMNMKGYRQDYGLERYPFIDALNLGAQIQSETLLKHAIEFRADIILVSQTVTQKDIHIHNFTALIELLEAENLRGQFCVIAGGARMNNELAKELGYDAGFGAGTLPSEVASFIVYKMLS